MFFNILYIITNILNLISMNCLYRSSSIRIFGISFIICFSSTLLTLRMSFSFGFVFPRKFFFVFPLFTFCTLFFHNQKTLKVKWRHWELNHKPWVFQTHAQQPPTLYLRNLIFSLARTDHLRYRPNNPLTCRV